MPWSNITKKRRPAVAWTVAPEERPVNKPVSRRHIHDAPIAPEKIEVYASAMTPGSMWQLKFPLAHERLPPGTIAASTPVLIRPSRRHVVSGYDFLPVGSLALYFGETRVQEKKKKLQLQVIRHMFIIGGGKYIIPDLNWIEPVT